MVQLKCFHDAPKALFCIVLILGLLAFHQTASCQSGPTANAFLISADNMYVESLYDYDQDGSEEFKSKSRGVLYGLASTALPAGLGALVDGDAGAALIAIGVIAGPSAGIAYACDYGRAGKGLGIRTAGAGIATVGALIYLLESLEVEGNQPVGNFLIAGGLSLTGMSALYDIFIASPKAVERYNEKLEKDEIELNPWMNPETGGAGLSLSIRF